MKKKKEKLDHNKRRNLITISVILVVIVAVVLSAFIIVTRKHGGTVASEDTLELTDVQKLAVADLEANYPASAPAVVDYYYRINKALFEYECTQDEIKQLAHQEWMLFDEELQELNPEKQLVNVTSAEVNQKRADGLTISSYVVPQAREINDTLITVNGKEVVNANVIVTMKKGQVRYSYYYTFVLRKDDDKRWKILGFQETPNLQASQ